MILLADLPADTRPAPPSSSPAAPAPAAPPEPLPPPEPSSTLTEYDRETLRLHLDSKPASTPLARYGLSARLALGASYQVLYTVPITSAELELGFGGRVGNQAAYLTVDVERGRTELGLHTAGWHVGLIGEWWRGPFRFGFQVRAGAMFIDRVTEPNEDLASASFGVRGHVAWDFVRFSGGDALVAELGFRTDYYQPLVYGPSLLFGYRWESNRRVGGAR